MSDVFSGETFVCHMKDCGQVIFWKENQHIFVNMYDGVGGDKGNRHACPSRQERYKNRPEGPKEIVECNRCYLQFDIMFNFECPNCFQKCCQNCGTLWQWRGNQNKCPKCKSYYAKSIQMTKYFSEKEVTNPDIKKYPLVKSYFHKTYVNKPQSEIDIERVTITEEYKRFQLEELR
jgi:hypothetical protein